MRFESNQTVIKAVEVRFKEMSKNESSFVFQKWQEWWTKCILLEGVVFKRAVHISTNKYIFLSMECSSHYFLNSSCKNRHFKTVCAVVLHICLRNIFTYKDAKRNKIRDPNFTQCSNISQSFNNIQSPKGWYTRLCPACAAPRPQCLVN